ncbi:MAG: DUF2280 domain-containing protein [Balneolaceae bacterium]
MPTLKKQHKVHIISSLARYASYNEARQSLKDKFGVDINVSQVQAYNVSKEYTGNKGVGKELQELFYAERDKYLNEYGDLPLTRRGARLRELSEIAEMAKHSAQINGENDDLRVWGDAIMKIHRIMQDIEGGDNGKQAGEAENVKRFYQQINQNIYFNK